MADKPLDGNPQTKRGSTRNFAVKVFKETSVTAVSTILSTSNIPRKIFRTLVFIAFTAGFLTQIITFFSYLLEYPTVIDINIIRPDTYMSPAYTFCNRNTVKRSKFCQKYPEDCVVPDEKFCKKFPRYCGENRSLMPKLELPEMLEDMPELGNDIDDLFGQVTNITVAGPLIVAAVEEDDYAHYGCYAINSRIESPLEPFMRSRQQIWGEDYDEFSFNPEENETFHPGSKSGIVFAIDSPFNPVNPFDKGIIMKPGNFYKIFVRMQEETLLPYPYKTDCVDYREKWLKNHKRGHRSQKACEVMCLQQFSHSCLNCRIPLNGYESDLRICSPGEVLKLENCTETEYSLFEKCSMDCKEECQKMKYLYEVQEIPMASSWIDNEMDMSPRIIKVQIRFEDSEIVATRYRAQYQSVEAFSYVGGFIGIWLGVSLVQVADVLESLFRIGRHYFKRRRSTAGNKQDGNQI